MKKKTSLSDKLVSTFSHIVLTVFALICVYPLLLSLSVSFSDNFDVQKNGYKLIPAKWSLDAYKFALEGDWLVNSYLVTIIVVVVGTLLSMFISSMLAYAISVKTLKYRNHIAMYCFITMVFTVGLVPWYIVLRRYYGFGNSLLSLIIPYLVNPWYIFLMRNYFESIPSSMSESATIDGAGNMTIYTRIILPLSTPILATVSLFTALIYWNDWWLAIMFVTQKRLFPLQYQLYNILSNILFLSSEEGQAHASNIKLPSETIQMAITMLTIGPVVLIYPFIQKYFTKGIMIGAVKG